MSEEPPKRSTRGKRIDVSKLAELEAEQDEFWGKGGQGGDLFAEESDDESFDTSEEESENKEDSEDSDIDNPDNEKAEAVEVNEDQDKDEDEKKKKKNVYVDPARMKNKAVSTTKPAPSTEGITPEAGTEEPQAPRRGRKRKLLDGESEQKEGDEANEGDGPAKKKQKKEDDARQLRKSTVQYSEERKIIRKIERDEADQRRKKRRQNKKVDKQFSQEELLAEALETEKVNQASLAEMMKLEEERKKIVAPKSKYPFNLFFNLPSLSNCVLWSLTLCLTILGPRVITLSRAKSHTVTFTDVDDLPAFLRAKAPPYPNQAMCVITGLPAKYFDPVTQMPYATPEAFKQLRAKYVK
jgi:vacuolar protein sorting-associated protein 72